MQCPTQHKEECQEPHAEIEPSSLHITFSTLSIYEFEPTIYTSSLSSYGIPIGLSTLRRITEMDIDEYEKRQGRKTRQVFMKEGYLMQEDREDILTRDLVPSIRLDSFQAILEESQVLRRERQESNVVIQDDIPKIHEHENENENDKIWKGEHTIGNEGWKGEECGTGLTGVHQDMLEVQMITDAQSFKAFDPLPEDDLPDLLYFIQHSIGVETRE